MRMITPSIKRDLYTKKLGANPERKKKTDIVFMFCIAPPSLACLSVQLNIKIAKTCSATIIVNTIRKYSSGAFI